MEICKIKGFLPDLGGAFSPKNLKVQKVLKTYSEV